MMKKLLLHFLILTISVVFNQINAQNVNLEWAKSTGGAGHDESPSITTDVFGNIYTTGFFEDTVDFDPGVGVVNLVSNGSKDIFIQKLDSNGNFLWAKSMGGTSNEEGYSIITDALGNVYTTGFFEGTSDFNPGVGITNLTSNGLRDIFIQKLDNNGNLLWVKSIGGTNNEEGHSITIDISGNVYTTGNFENTVDFDPGAGVANLTSNGTRTAFIQKLDSNGNLLWVKPMGVYGFSITTDASGNVYTTGFFWGTSDFDPGAGVTNLVSNGSYDIFIQKLDSNGNFLWAHSIGSTGDDIGNSITIDDFGNVYTTGVFENTVDFDPGTGITNLVSNGYRDIFIQKMDANGNFLWAKSMGTWQHESGNSIVSDEIGSVYTTGYFRYTVDFDPGVGVSNLVSNSTSEDIFIQKLDSNGNFLWAKSMGGIHHERGLSIIRDALGHIYTTGLFYGTVDFDPEAGVTNLVSNGSFDIFIQKLSPFCTTSHTDIQNACSSYTWINGVTYTSSNNTAKDTLVNAAGCDSIITLNLTITNSTSSTDVQTACNSYTWIDGITYTSSNNTAKDTLVNAAGCDSVITLNLTITNSTSSTDVQTACGSYTWINGVTYTSSNNTAKDTLVNAAGCDSIITLNLTITNSTSSTDVQTACGSYTWINGVTYTSSNNTAKDTLVNAAGCDSIITLNLTINTIDNTVTKSGATLAANESGATYQWLDCDNSNAPITDKTNQSFIATSNGKYAVSITKGSCKDTSDCITVSTIIDGIATNTTSHLIIYPNPTTGLIHLTSEDVIQDVEVYNLVGKVVLTTQNKTTINLSSLEAGMYLIKVKTNTGVILKEVIKE